MLKNLFCSHELIHMYDHCTTVTDFKNVEDLACSEVGNQYLFLKRNINTVFTSLFSELKINFLS
jgi:hypothetical protein